MMPRQHEPQRHYPSSFSSHRLVAPSRSLSPRPSPSLSVSPPEVDPLQPPASHYAFCSSFSPSLTCSTFLSASSSSFAPSSSSLFAFHASPSPPSSPFLPYQPSPSINPLGLSPASPSPPGRPCRSSLSLPRPFHIWPSAASQFASPSSSPNPAQFSPPPVASPFRTSPSPPSSPFLSPWGRPACDLPRTEERFASPSLSRYDAPPLSLSRSGSCSLEAAVSMREETRARVGARRLRQREHDARGGVSCARSKHFEWNRSSRARSLQFYAGRPGTRCEAEETPADEGSHSAEASRRRRQEDDHIWRIGDADACAWEPSSPTVAVRKGACLSRSRVDVAGTRPLSAAGLASARVCKDLQSFPEIENSHQREAGRPQKRRDTRGASPGHARLSSQVYVHGSPQAAAGRRRRPGTPTNIHARFVDGCSSRGVPSAPVYRDEETAHQAEHLEEDAGGELLVMHQEKERPVWMESLLSSEPSAPERPQANRREPRGRFLAAASSAPSLCSSFASSAPCTCASVAPVSHHHLLKGVSAPCISPDQTTTCSSSSLDPLSSLSCSSFSFVSAYSAASSGCRCRRGSPSEQLCGGAPSPHGSACASPCPYSSAFLSSPPSLQSPCCISSSFQSLKPPSAQAACAVCLPSLASSRHGYAVPERGRAVAASPCCAATPPFLSASLPASTSAAQAVCASASSALSFSFAASPSCAATATDASAAVPSALSFSFSSSVCLAAAVSPPVAEEPNQRESASGCGVPPQASSLSLPSVRARNPSSETAVSSCGFPLARGVDGVSRDAENDDLQAQLDRIQQKAAVSKKRDRVVPSDGQPEAGQDGEEEGGVQEGERESECRQRGIVKREDAIHVAGREARPSLLASCVVPVEQVEALAAVAKVEARGSHVVFCEEGSESCEVGGACHMNERKAKAAQTRAHAEKPKDEASPFFLQSDRSRALLARRTTSASAETSEGKSLCSESESEPDSAETEDESLSEEELELEGFCLSELLGRGAAGKRRWKKLARQGERRDSFSRCSFLSSENELSFSLSSSSPCLSLASSPPCSPSSALANTAAAETAAASRSPPAPSAADLLAAHARAASPRRRRKAGAAGVPASVRRTLAVRRELRDAALQGSLRLLQTLSLAPCAREKEFPGGEGGGTESACGKTGGEGARRSAEAAADGELSAAQARPGEQETENRGHGDGAASPGEVDRAWIQATVDFWEVAEAEAVLSALSARQNARRAPPAVK
ncbi:hypothetical protein BESB_077200 [Besnoitia besnoiti]|uniref:Uncharacterized protein n=1 Tax=Besnoitia besnoiti TaxID=94643 RepID=A0A2A9MCV5_BESBE|nr:hypothetical protein BESB_077200 [Besnoitia besnoiti]PFH33503.1 hypothetical protein BESB_077200 [Besnoitia besnoiti]